MEIKGYKVLTVPLFFKGRSSSPFSSNMYIRQHASKRDEDLPEGRTLFLANIPFHPQLDTVAYLKEAFGRHGEVEDVKINADFQEEGFRSAIGFVIFRTSKALKKALKEDTSLPGPSRECVRKFKGQNAEDDIQVLIKRFRSKLPKVSELQSEVDAFMARFEEAEAEEERKRKESMNRPDADGFITVSYGKKRGKKRGQSNGPENRKRRKKKKNELQNFYAHQIREAKRETLARLRQKFEEDKARIERMKAARKFKPFG